MQSRDVSSARPSNGSARIAPKAAKAPTKAPPNDPAKQTALITGGNTGIGFATATALGAKGYHTVIACRDEQRGTAALGRLRAANPKGSFELRLLELDNLANVRDFCAKSCDFGHPVDVLVNNAGVMACPEMRTQDGYEYQFGVNHLGHFALTAGLLPLMADPSRSSRIVTVSSAAHLVGDIHFDDINLRRGYNEWVAYGQAKLANIMFTFELAKRLPYAAGVTANTLHPGVVNTELSRFLVPSSSKNSFLYPAVERVLGAVLKTPEQGAETSIFLAAGADVEGVTSKYYVDCRPRTASHKAYDAERRRRLWDLSCEMAGVEFDVAAVVGKQAALLA